jgi:hypothetical protein
MISQRVENYKQIIHECFLQDQALLDKWHIEAGNGLEKCVERTFKDMSDAKVEFYAVTDRNFDLVGYFGKELTHGTEFLTGFFVCPKYRNQKDLSQFWSLVKSNFKKPFYCGLYDKNKPAINFITKNNGKPFLAAVNAKGEPASFFQITE